MIFKQRINNEEGFLLLENLITLGVISSVLLIIFPLIVEWVILKEEAKKVIEGHRIFYEYTFEGHDEPSTILLESGIVVSRSENVLSVMSKDFKVEVEIYESMFE